MQHKVALPVRGFMYGVFGNLDGQVGVACIAADFGIVIADKIDKTHPGLGLLAKVVNDGVMRGGPMHAQRMPDVEDIPDEVNDGRAVAA
jgi:hypothetical protein